MPTARPIIVIMLVTKKESSPTWPTTAVRPKAIAIETIARMIGTTAATRAPKTTIRMMKAIAGADRSRRGRDPPRRSC